MTIKCFNEDIKASNKNCKVNKSAVCFLFNTFFLHIFIVEVYTVLSKVYTVFFIEKVGGFEKSRLLGGCEKNRLLILTLIFITNTKQ